MSTLFEWHKRSTYATFRARDAAQPDTFVIAQRLITIRFRFAETNRDDANASAAEEKPVIAQLVATQAIPPTACPHVIWAFMAAPCSD